MVGSEEGKPEGREQAQPPLEVEWETYKQLYARLIGTAPGKYALLIGTQLIDTYNDALKVGYSKAALKPFLVKQILHNDRDIFKSPLGSPSL